MGSLLLCCVALCLLGAGSVDSGVIQTPKYMVKARRQSVNLECSYEPGHLYVYWYQQTQGQGPQFLVQYYDGQERNKEKLPDRFTVQQFKDSYHSKLTASSLELEDSALYLCASSLAQP